MIRHILIPVFCCLLLSCGNLKLQQGKPTTKVPTRPQPQFQPLSILLIGWDGVQRNHLLECLERKELPHLQALIDEGGLVEIDIEGKTDTKAGWAEILTGYGPKKNRVTSNSVYAPIPEGYTIFERLEKHFGADEVVTVMIGGKSNNIGARGPHTKKPKRKKRKKKAEGKKYEGEPYFITQNHMDFFKNGLGHGDNVGELALQLLDEHHEERFFMFIHFQDPDHAGHKHGENSDEYNDAIILCDRWLAKIRARLEELGHAERTLIYVTSDHGFNEGAKHHKSAPYVFLATNDDDITADGMRDDIGPTILECIGLDPAQIEPALDGSSLAR
jgi:hypothetical protein